MPNGMVGHMKTTVNIADALFEELRELAEKEGVTMKSLIQDGIRQVIAEHKKVAKQPRYKMRDVSFGGEGVQEGIDLANWPQIRALIYEGHGG